MKKVLMQFEGGGAVWMVTHRLFLTAERYRQIRPIHIWTFLGGYKKPAPPKGVNNLFTALENKLSGVRLARSRLRESLSYVFDASYSHSNVLDYEGEQRVMFDMDAYLNVVYSALEITSMLNQKQNPTLPRGFRSQAKKGKFALFEFS